MRLSDPPRPEVPAAIAACRRAGIRVMMLTGDHPATARRWPPTSAWATRPPTVVEGATLNRLSDAALLRKMARNAIFARIDPEQKLRLVRVLRAAGEVVVATGDGINDASPCGRRTSVWRWGARLRGGQTGGGHRALGRQFRHHHRGH
ncbi:MAG: HAD family hydrolase [Dehalococcoidia bacterium]